VDVWLSEICAGFEPTEIDGVAASALTPARAVRRTMPARRHARPRRGSGEPAREPPGPWMRPRFMTMPSSALKEVSIAMVGMGEARERGRLHLFAPDEAAFRDGQDDPCEFLLVNRRRDHLGRFTAVAVVEFATFPGEDGLSERRLDRGERDDGRLPAVGLPDKVEAAGRLEDVTQLADLERPTRPDHGLGEARGRASLLDPPDVTAAMPADLVIRELEAQETEPVPAP